MEYADVITGLRLLRLYDPFFRFRVERGKDAVPLLVSFSPGWIRPATRNIRSS